MGRAQFLSQLQTWSTINQGKKRLNLVSRGYNDSCHWNLPIIQGRNNTCGALSKEERKTQKQLGLSIPDWLNQLLQMRIGLFRKPLEFSRFLFSLNNELYRDTWIITGKEIVCWRRETNGLRIVPEPDYYSNSEEKGGVLMGFYGAFTYCAFPDCIQQPERFPICRSHCFFHELMSGVSSITVLPILPLQ